MRAFSFYIIFFLSLAIVTLSVTEASAQFTDKTFDAAFRTLKDGTSKVDSLNKLCRALDDDGKAIACGIKVSELAEKLNYQKALKFLEK